MIVDRISSKQMVLRISAAVKHKPKQRYFAHFAIMLRTLLAAVQYPNVGDPLPETWQQYQALFDWIECHKVDAVHCH